MTIFPDLMPSLRIGNWAPSVLRKHLFNEETQSIEKLCQMTMESDGEFSSLLLAERILNEFERLQPEALDHFFDTLNDNFDLDLDALKAAIANYETSPSTGSLATLSNAAEPKRRELLRRLNLAPGATKRLVKMRESLSTRIRQKPELAKIDNDFRHLFSAWFNRGFLLLQPMEWTTPAHILDKIIDYEAVHEIKNWEELRTRLEPADRHCYAFFHPSMDDEPLVFVEVALTREVPEGIAQILNRDSALIEPEDASCAIFYSISNCHTGLSGVSFGNFLIKQVATSLKQRFPQLKTFATISPAPGFRKWLVQQAEHNGQIAGMIDNFGPSASDPEIKAISQLAARYFLEEKNSRNEPLDPVARFHLKNGASLDRLNVLADLSDKGMKQSLGLMVNYVYDLSKVEDNHEAYMTDHTVVCSNRVRKLFA